MREEKDFTKDLAEIRSMMERSSKFLSLSGLAGIMAGIYATAGIYIACSILGFRPDSLLYGISAEYGTFTKIPQLILTASLILALALITAVYLSYRKSAKRGEKIRNAATRQLLLAMSLPLVSGGLIILILLIRGMAGLVLPLSLIFYGLSLFSASRISGREVQMLGITQTALGLISMLFPEFSVYIWAAGFGIVHFIYGIVIFYRYER
ncbi:MAG: hypothetical protein L6Q59_16530 [Ignavibacteriaceae bacterium]|nr:hypothetical protein [Ignavibacteriaceae bacterium]